MTEDGGGLAVPFQIDAGAFRGRLIRMGPAFGKIIGGHGYPPPVAAMVGEAAALAAALSGMLKYEGIFSLQIRGDGPIAMIVVDAASNGDMRAYARFDDGRLMLADGKGAGSVPHLLGAGYLAFTVDQGADTDRYQGIVELIGMDLGACARHYFLHSEQLETAIRLAVRLPGGDGAGGDAAALVLQRMPVASGAPILTADEADEAWRTARILLDSLREEELLDAGLSPDRLLYRLFHGEGLQVFEARPLRARCRCSRGRVDATLRSFPRAELEEMRQEDGLIVVTCEFCKNRYTFDAGGLDALYAS